MRVLQMTTLHPPDDVRILLKECRALADHGHDVVLAARVHAATELDGIEIVPIGTVDVRTGLHNLVRRLFAAWRVARAAKADAYHLHDPELIPVGLALERTGRRVVYDVHENTPLDLRTLGDGSLGGRVLARMWAVVEALAGRRFDAVVAATPAIHGSFPPAKTFLVRNFPLLSETTALAGPPQRDRERSVVYIGRVSEDRGVRTMLEAADRADVTLRLAGLLPPALLEELRHEPLWARARYAGRLSRAGVAEEVRRARAGMLVLEPRQAYVESLPVKLFEYMAAGIPVIASDFPIWREIVEGAACGVLVDPSDPRAIAEAIEWVLANPDEAEELGARGREAVRETYNWERESGELLAAYARLSPSPA
jgi:hypothetical protein